MDFNNNNKIILYQYISSYISSINYIKNGSFNILNWFVTWNIKIYISL